MEPFDNYYISGGQKPTLNLEPTVLSLIELLELQKPLGYTNTVIALLDVSVKIHKLLAEKIKEIRSVRASNTFASGVSMFDKNKSIGVTLLSQPNDIIEQALITVCNERKDQLKGERWIGLGFDNNDTSVIANSFYFLD